MVQAYHPRHFLGRDGPDNDDRENLLKEIIGRFIGPFGEWKAVVFLSLQVNAVMMKFVDTMDELHVALDELLMSMYRVEKKLATRITTKES